MLCSVSRRSPNPTNLKNVYDIIAERQLALFGHVVRLHANTPAHQSLKQTIDVKYMCQLDASGEDLLDNCATPGNSILKADHRWASDSPEKLLMITGRSLWASATYML